MKDSYAQNILDLYKNYITWSADLMDSFGGIKMFSQMFTGGTEYKNREEHKSFIAACEKAAEEYLEALRGGEAPREELLSLLKYVLLDCHGECDEWAEWMLLAAEKNFLPYVELLKTEEAEALYEPYRRLRRKNRGLPPQDEFLKKLKKLSR